MNWSWLIPAWLRPRAARKKRELNRLRLLFYTRKKCSLCDQAWSIVTTLQRRYGFQTEVFDVEEDARLVELYGDKVPVVCANDHIICWGRFNQFVLKRFLDGRLK